MTTFFSLIISLLGILFLGILIFTIYIGVKNRKQNKLIAKSVVRSIKTTAVHFTFLTIFTTVMVAALIGNQSSMSKISSSITNSIEANTYQQLVIDSPENYDEVSSSWDDIPTYASTDTDYFIENSTDLYGDESLYYVQQALINYDENVSNISFSLNVTINLYATINGELYPIQISRLEDVNEYNTFTDSKGDQHTVNEIYNTDDYNTYESGDSQIPDNQIYLVSGYPQENNIKSSDTFSVTPYVPYGTFNSYNDSSSSIEKAPYISVDTELTSGGEQINEVNPVSGSAGRSVGRVVGNETDLTVGDITYASSYMTPSAELAMSKGSSMVQPTDINQTLIGYVNETTFEKIFIDILSEINTQITNAGYVTDNVEIFSYMQEQNLINISYGVVFEDVYNKVFNSGYMYFSYDDYFNDLAFELNSNLADYFTWDAKNVSTAISEDPSSEYHWVSEKNSVFNSKHSVYSWNDSSYVPNISMVTAYNSFQNYNSISRYINIVLIIVGVVIIGVILTKIIKRSDKELGTLKALGFSPDSIAISYIIYPTISILISFIIGLALASPIALWWISMFGANLSVNFAFSSFTTIALLGIALNVIALFAIFSFIVAKIVISKPTLSLIKSTSENKANIIVKSIDKASVSSDNFKTTFTIKSSFRNMKKSIFMFSTIGGTTLFMLFAMSAGSVVDTSVQKSFETLAFDALEFTPAMSAELSSEMTDTKYVSNETFENNVDVIDINPDTNPAITNPDSPDPDSQDDYVRDVIKFIDSYSFNEWTSIMISDAVTFVTEVNDLVVNASGRTESQRYKNVQDRIFPGEYKDGFLRNLTNAISDAIDSADSNTQYISFGNSSYNPETQSPAIVTTPSYYIDFNNDGVVDNTENIGMSLSVIGNPSEISEEILIKDSEGNNAIYEYTMEPDTLIDGEYYTNIIVDSMTAASLGIDVGDIIYIEYDAKLFNGSSTVKIPAVVQSVGFSAIPFGAVVPSTSYNVWKYQTTETDTSYANYESLGGANDDFYRYITAVTMGDFNSEVYQDGINYDVPYGVSTSLSGTASNSMIGSDLITYVNDGGELIQSYAFPFPMFVPQNMVQETIAPITQVMNVVMLTIIVVALTLIMLSVSDSVTATASEANVMQALGYKPSMIALITTFGYFVMFLISFALAIPITLAFISIVNSNIVFAAAGSIYLGITSTQILTMLFITIGIYVITYLSAFILYSTQNPSNALKTTK